MKLYSTNPAIQGIGGHVQSYSIDDLPILEISSNFSFLLAFDSNELELNKNSLKAKLKDHWVGKIDLIDCIEQGSTPEERWYLKSCILPSIEDNFEDREIYVYRSESHKERIIVKTDLLKQFELIQKQWWEQGNTIGTIFQGSFQKSIFNYCETLCKKLGSLHVKNGNEAFEKKHIILRLKSHWAELRHEDFFERGPNDPKQDEITKNIEIIEEKSTGEWEYYSTKEKQIEATPTIRISAQTPATNLKLISDLIGNAKVDAVFDPYLDNNGLIALGNIFSLGSSPSKILRILTCLKSTELNEDFFEDWLKEQKINAEIRRMPSSEHSRFLLLNNKKSLRIGVSLNGLKNNEAAHLDSNQEDLHLFNSVWDRSNSFFSKKELIKKNPEKEKKINRIVEDWNLWKTDQERDFKRAIDRKYNGIDQKEGMILAWFDRKFLKTYPTPDMIEENNRKTIRMRIKFERELEDLGLSKVEIDKLLK